LLRLCAHSYPFLLVLAAGCASCARSERAPATQTEAKSGPVAAGPPPTQLAPKTVASVDKSERSGGEWTKSSSTKTVVKDENRRDPHTTVPGNERDESEEKKSKRPTRLRPPHAPAPDSDGDGGGGPPQVYRTGALRLGRDAKSVYQLGYQPAPGPRLAKLQDKLKGRKPEARVTPFASEAVTGDGIQPVDRGGEIVAIALALQLAKIGWQVDVAGKERLAAGLPVPGTETTATAFQITGTVKFATTPTGATLAGRVQFARAGKPVLEVSPSVSGSSTARLVTARRREAAEQALARFVSAVLADPRLDPALTASLR
jgi:hypothetical protein